MSCSWSFWGFVLAFFILTVCSPLFADAAPAIKFTHVPPKDPGGPFSMGVITGQVNGPHEGLKLVLYARNGRDRKWYVQPYIRQPFTTVLPDSSWNSATHLGTEYAALLVKPDYIHPAITGSLPAEGGGVVAVAIVEGTPPFWERWWFRLLVVLLTAFASVAFYRWRMREMAQHLNLRFEERLAKRTRIAKEIHDTLLQGCVSASMQLHLLTDELTENSPQKKRLDHVLKLMAQVIDEGENAVRGLRLPSDSPSDLEDVFSRFPQELATSEQTDFRIIVEGPSRKLHPIIRDEVYRIGREALSNAFRHSGAHSVQVELGYGDHELRVLIRDNGRGIDPQVLELGGEGHFGLAGMRDRAQSIGAKLKIWSSARAGTEVGLSIPGRIAFVSQASGAFSRWFWMALARKSNSSSRIRTQK